VLLHSEDPHFTHSHRGFNTLHTHTHTHTVLTVVDQSDVSGSSSSLIAGLTADGDQLRPEEGHLTVRLVDPACVVVGDVSLDGDPLWILHQGAPHSTSVTAPNDNNTMRKFRQEY